jgi:putative flippase GtrA
MKSNKIEIVAFIKQTFERWVSIRFIWFLVVGLTGIGVQLLALAILYRWLTLPFVVAQIASGYGCNDVKFLLE